MLVHFKKQTQVGVLLLDKVCTEVSTKYSDNSNVFLAENAIKLPENIEINEHIIQLKKSKQLLFDAIHSLRPIELEILKIYIETNVANGFIQLFKSPTRAFILFDKKPDKNFCLCINY